MSIYEKWIKVEMPDSSSWAVPVKVIADDRAKHYAHEFNDDIQQSLKEDTLPLFEDDDFEIFDWASNNMNWSDVEPYAEEVCGDGEVDYQEGWVNGEQEIIDEVTGSKTYADIIKYCEDIEKQIQTAASEASGPPEKGSATP